MPACLQFRVAMTGRQTVQVVNVFGKVAGQQQAIIGVASENGK
jgi:hypothetical protein